ncbi:MAG: MBL fold metallo-hydrolase [Bacteroidetes bacterium]|nr:MBL fold metallo-hydrolase [Bacteroidota bacterium]MDA1121394.1 MBL fold metallo-hydrolase [Bacteroidota bacterium]
MRIEQIYTGCLAQGAYYVESDGEAAIIDPLRETSPYVEKAKSEGAIIKYILETHFHADFVSGHVDLAQKTGATIIYGPGAKTGYSIHEATDGEILKLGNVSIKVLHTPGHTMESTTYLLIDENGNDHAIFSGDTLFIGDVGRPDLAIKGDVTEKDLAGMLFESLRNKIMPLSNDVIVYPAHGAGSACGKNMSKQTWDTLGNQKESNYALRNNMTKDEFIKEVTEGILPPPQYFAKNAMINKQGYEAYDVVMERGMIPLDVDTFEAIANHEGALVLDTRNREEFIAAFIPNSIFVGLDGTFAPWVGTLVTDIKQPILFIADEGKEEEVVKRLARVGYDNILGYLEGGIKAWLADGKEVDHIKSINAQELAKKLSSDKALNIVDSRRSTEFSVEHAEMAKSVPLDYINKNMDELDSSKQYYIHCAGGYRSVIMCSILKSRGFDKIANIEGGFALMKSAGIGVASSSLAH